MVVVCVGECCVIWLFWGCGWFIVVFWMRWLVGLLNCLYVGEFGGWFVFLGVVLGFCLFPFICVLGRLYSLVCVLLAGDSCGMGLQFVVVGVFVRFLLVCFFGLPLGCGL